LVFCIFSAQLREIAPSQLAVSIPKISKLRPLIANTSLRPKWPWPAANTSPVDPAVHRLQKRAGLSAQRWRMDPPRAFDPASALRPQAARTVVAETQGRFNGSQPDDDRFHHPGKFVSIYSCPAAVVFGSLGVGSAAQHRLSAFLPAAAVFCRCRASNLMPRSFRCCCQGAGLTSGASSVLTCLRSNLVNKKEAMRTFQVLSFARRRLRCVCLAGSSCCCCGSDLTNAMACLAPVRLAMTHVRIGTIFFTGTIFSSFLIVGLLRCDDRCNCAGQGRDCPSVSRHRHR